MGCPDSAEAPFLMAKSSGVTCILPWALEGFRTVKGIKEIYAERVIFYNHYIQVRIQSDTEIYLLNVIYRKYVVTESEKDQINNPEDKW